MRTRQLPLRWMAGVVGATALVMALCDTEPFGNVPRSASASAAPWFGPATLLTEATRLGATEAT